MIAKPEHWKHLPFAETVSIPYSDSFDPIQFERLNQGLIPEVMEDKWFIYADELSLMFHRSWTGQAVYRITLERSGDVYNVAEAICASEMLINSDGNYHAELLGFLVHNLLLGETRPFPLPAGVQDQHPGIYQHVVSGTGYPEAITGKRPWWRFWH